LSRLDDFGLLLIEQPFEHDALDLHAQLARRCVTPICLDESLVSAATTAAAIRAGACSVVNIKAARMGGYLEARRAHDVATALNTPVWCGGMLETGLGRAANLALASLPGFTLPGDISASARYYAEDVTEPFMLVDGKIAVPDGPGLGVRVRDEILQQVVTSRRSVAE
jgi:O-succinylbenzoate synthase